MKYPSYPSQPMTGSPFAFDQGPPDFLPSGHNPRYGVYAGVRGRQLAGLGRTSCGDDAPAPIEMPTADGPSWKDYPNELDTLAQADDVQGNGIFDAAGTHGNIHGDDGIFADRQGIPGYLAREKFFQPSEVIDMTTGDPVMFVPGNAFMLDPRTDGALQDLSLYLPGLPSTGGRQTPYQSTVIPNEPAWPIGVVEPGDEPAEEPPPPTHEPASKTNMFVMAALAGLALGGLYAVATRKK